jgi:hypothetical protein
VAISAFEHEARILQFPQLPSLLINNLAQTLRDTKRLAAIGHHLCMETHPPVDEELVDSRENLVAALHSHELAYLQA